MQRHQPSADKQRIAGHAASALVVLFISACVTTRYPVKEEVFAESPGLTLALANIRNFACAEKNCAQSIEDNKQKILDVIDQLKQRRDAPVNMIVFPEFSLTGYFWKDEGAEESEECWSYMDQGVLDRHKEWLKEVKSRLDGDLQYVVINSIRRNPAPAKSGERQKFLNSTLVIDRDFDCDDFSKDEATHIYDKTFLPGIEKTYTTSGRTDWVVIETPWGRFGLTTCYDLCFAQLYQEYVMTHQVDAILQLASWRGTSERRYPVATGSKGGVVESNYYGYIWDLMAADRAATNQIWLFAANAVGKQAKGDYTFWGGSGVWAPSGVKIVEAPHDKEELVVVHNLEIKEEVKKERDDFDYRKDFLKVYTPLPAPHCSSKDPGVGSASFTRQKLECAPPSP